MFYPGSIERTSFAEVGEEKGFMLLRVDTASGGVSWEFRSLPARPMERHEVNATHMDGAALERSILGIVHAAPVDAVVSIRVAGELIDAHWRVMSAKYLRSRVPETMNLDVTPVSGFARQSRSTPKPRTPSLQHALFAE